MPKRTLLLQTIVSLMAASSAAEQSTISVDLLDPADDGFEGIPVYRRCVDVYVDIDPADVWTVGGLRISAHHGARFEYYDGDGNVPVCWPVWVNLGVQYRFDTSLSRPRPRNAAARFTNGAAAVAGGFDPVAIVEDGSANFLNIAYFASPPMTSGSPSADGYIARISVDVQGVVPTDDYAGWFAGDLANAPPGALIVLRSEPVSAVAGTVFTTFDDPTIRGINWGLWYVPEPATIGAAVLLAALVRRMSRTARRI